MIIWPVEKNPSSSSLKSKVCAITIINILTRKNCFKNYLCF